MSADALNRITSVIVGAAIDVHRALGAGLLEAAYLGCLCFELAQRGLRIETQKPIPLIYHGVRIECAFRADLIVEECVIVEVKANETLAPAHFRQVQTYLRLADRPVGLILNFGAKTWWRASSGSVNNFPSEEHPVSDRR